MIKHWYTNGIIDKKFYDTDTIPEGFIRGRTNYGSFTKGTKWITNGMVQKCIKASEPLPDGFRYGKLPDSEEHKQNLSKALKGRVFTEDWCNNISKGHKTTKYKQKVEQTCLLKYGVKNPFNQPNVIEKVHSKEMIQRQNDTKRKNNTFCSSKAEDKFYEYLLTIFEETDIVRQYSDERYPFNCDFYIKSLDLFIECNFHWTHNNHYFDETNEQDIEKLNMWKSKNSKYYKIAINVWTSLDIRKKEYSKQLNYIVLWNQSSMIEDFLTAFNDGKIDEVQHRVKHHGAVEDIRAACTTC